MQISYEKPTISPLGSVKELTQVPKVCGSADYFGTRGETCDI